jgi:hypothetical protein
MGFRLVLTAAFVIGGTIETSSGNPRVVLNGPADELQLYDSNGVLVGTWGGANGDLTLGSASLNGTINLLPEVGQINIQNPGQTSFIALDAPSQAIEVKETQFGQFVLLNTDPAQINFAITNGPAAVVALGGGPTPTQPFLSLEGPQGGSGNWDEFVTLGLWPGKSPGNGNVRGKAILVTGFNDQVADLWLSGNVVTCSTDGSTANAWQTQAVLQSGWALGPSSGTVQSYQYGVANGSLLLDGAVHTTSATPSSTLTTLPAAYRPPITKRGPYAVLNSGGTPTVLWVEVNSNGNITLHTNPTTSGADVYFSARIPLNSTNPT